MGFTVIRSSAVIASRIRCGRDLTCSAVMVVSFTARCSLQLGANDGFWLLFRPGAGAARAQAYVAGHDRPRCPGASEPVPRAHVLPALPGRSAVPPRVSQ